MYIFSDSRLILVQKIKDPHFFDKKLLSALAHDYFNLAWPKNRISSLILRNGFEQQKDILNLILIFKKTKIRSELHKIL